MTNTVKVIDEDALSNEVQAGKNDGFLAINTPDLYEGGSESVDELTNEVTQLENERELASNPKPKEPKEDEGLVVEDEPVNQIEQTFKKRYADLRKHTQKKDDTISQLKKEVSELQVSQVQSKLPTTPEELEQFKTKYPDVFNVVQSVVMSENVMLKQDLDTKLSELQEKADLLEEDQAALALQKRHPDLQQIEVANEFKDWIQGKPKSQQDFIIEKLGSGRDVDTADSLLQQFKLETGYGKNKVTKPKANISAAEKVTTPNVSEPTETTKRVFSESEIDRMKIQEYEALEQEILEAHRDGRVTLDMSA